MWKRTSFNDWKLSYLVVYNQCAFLYDSPLSEKPYDYFDLGCCVCQSATQNLIEKPVSQFESKQAGQYQVRETQFDQVPYEFMLYSSENSLRNLNNFALQQDVQQFNIDGENSNYLFMVSQRQYYDLSTIKTHPTVQNLDQWTFVFQQSNAQTLVDACAEALKMKLKQQFSNYLEGQTEKGSLFKSIVDCS